MATTTLAVNVNTPAPDFTLTSHLDQPIHLADYLGKKNVILFFVRTYNCYSCREHVAHLARTYPELQRYDAEVLVILNANVADAKRYADVTRAPFPVLADTTHEIYNLYGLNQIFLLSTRTGSVVVDKAGVVTYIRSQANPWGWRNETETLLNHLVKSQHPELEKAN